MYIVVSTISLSVLSAGCRFLNIYNSYTHKKSKHTLTQIANTIVPLNQHSKSARHGKIHCKIGLKSYSDRDQSNALIRFRVQSCTKKNPSIGDKGFYLSFLFICSFIWVISLLNISTNRCRASQINCVWVVVARFAQCIALSNQVLWM